LGKINNKNMEKENLHWSWSIPDWLLERKDLDFGEKITLAILGRLGALEKPVHPSQKWLAEKMGITDRQIRNILNKLEKKGLVEKTGKIWKLNAYIVVRGKNFLSSEEKISSDSEEKISSDKRVIHSRDIHKENIYYNNQIVTNNRTVLHSSDKENIDNNTKKNNILSVATQSVAGKEINELISLFKEVNPTYERLFSNKTQRQAVERLVKKFGKEEVANLVKMLPKIIGNPYAPRITTPLQLEHKLADLLVYLKQEQNKKPKVAVIKTK
jgi:DNA-binding Lrp family transcriptional regulator